MAAIARAATGSFRDALGTLDQLVAYGGKQVDTDDVLAVLGVAEAELILAAADAIAAEDGRAALEASERLARSGRDVAQFGRDLLAHLRQLLVIRTIGEVPDTFSVTAADPERLRVQAEAFSDLALARAIDAIAAALAAIKEGDEPRMTLELAVLRAARPAARPVARRRWRSGSSELERVGRRAGAGRTSPRPPSDPDADAAEPERRPGPRTAAVHRGGGRRGGGWTSSGSAACGRRCSTRSASRARSCSRPCSPPRARSPWTSSRRCSRSAFRPAPPSTSERPRRKEARERLAEAVRTIVGERLRPVYVLLEGEEEAAAAAPSRSSARRS